MGPVLALLSAARHSGRNELVSGRKRSIETCIFVSLMRWKVYSTTSALAVGLGARLESIKCESSA